MELVESAIDGVQPSKLLLIKLSEGNENHLQDALEGGRDHL